MALKREIYRALEDVVGPENISEDPLILYSYVPLRPRLEAITGAAMPRFEAVTLPQNTGEVQAIVRLCNRYKIQYKAASTSWGGYGDPAGPGVVTSGAHVGSTERGNPFCLACRPGNLSDDALARDTPRRSGVP